ncbi:hypothetical protein LSCM1_05499 [Leishmania martiniquensis]|uniref:Kinesin motor domain-containing protein n=1 Tax=Leishmania martiniquensis TaxID=1580590 RepID=A0A836GGA2_9TRYP|nr:hypothetical protein LSCM1_05499 [Leishmania martiniquensis]
MAAYMPTEAPPRMPYQEEDRIRVYGRVRPPASPEAPLWVTTDGSGMTLHCGSIPSALPQTRATSSRHFSRTDTETQPRSFTLDGVVGDVHDSAARVLFESIAHSCVAGSLLKGTSATVLCCGEKGTGKTTTMFGDAVAHGLCQYILTSLFAAVAAQSEPSTSMFRSAMRAAAPSALNFATPCAAGAAEEEAERGLHTRYSIQLSCLELRGESVVDLLAAAVSDAPSSQTSSPRIAPPPQSALSSSFSSARPNISVDPRGKVVLHNVSKASCCSAADALALVYRSRRAYTSAPSPEASGHVIIIVSVTGEEGEGGGAAHHVVRTAQLYLVDLAAMEQLQHRGAKLQPSLSSKSPSITAAVTAAKSHSSRNANAALRHSLAALKEVIAKLSSSSTEMNGEASKVPPYKQSKLTMLLKGHLGGGCRTLVIAHVRSEEAHQTETIATLQLARQLLHVPQQPTSRVTEDPFALVRRLQRQVAALQAELRLQIELNEHATGSAAALAAVAPGEVSTTKDANGENRRSDKRSGSGAHQRALKSLFSRSSDRIASPTPTAGGAAGDCHPLLGRSASSCATPALSALATHVMNFVAGRIAVLPVTTVVEVRTCFELLRQCIAERDVQLSAALADLRAAESARATAFTAMAASSARSSMSECSSGRPTWSDRPPGAGGTGRRRIGSIRANSASVRDASAADGKRRPSMSSFQGTGTGPLPSGSSSHMTLLSEPSPSMPVRVGGAAGKGYGSAPPAAGLSKDANGDTVSPSLLPGLFAYSARGPADGATTGDAPPVAAAARLGTERITSTDDEAVVTSAHGEASSSLHHARVVSSAPVSRARPSATMNSREGPSPSLAMHSAMQVLRPHSATLVPAVRAALPASSRESHAFCIYTTRTAEGARLVQHLRQEEEALASLRMRRVTTATGGGSRSGIDLADECRYHESQLRCRREALLRNFELWYRAHMCAEGNATSEGDSVSPDHLKVHLVTPPRLTLGTMRRRLQQRSTVGSPSSGGSSGTTRGLVGGTAVGVIDKGTCDGWDAVGSSMPPAASNNVEVDGAGAAALASECFIAAGALSTAC